MRVGQKRAPRISVRIPPRNFSAAISVINRVLERQVKRELIDDVMVRWNIAARWIDESILGENCRGYVDWRQDFRTPKRATEGGKTNQDAAKQKKAKFAPPIHHDLN